MKRTLVCVLTVLAVSARITFSNNINYQPGKEGEVR
jgi:hypothetical protein